MGQTSDELNMKMESKWVSFLQTKVNSFTKWDLVRFFHDNPYAEETSDNIAQALGRDPKVVSRELAELAQVGVVEQVRVPNYEVYRFTSSDDVRQLVKAFMEACRDRQFRIQAINHVIEGLHFSARHDF
ncbi:MAG: winged helix-turn-helix domain-containing protein [Anaerolineae bacterium]|nr:winged helix-turn-helix domain-containing protein [Anaerolineae bacterium]MDW8172885.1 winged helix-turn-helix domain-containing protein [Anaerolineae bacterium]